MRSGRRASAKPASSSALGGYIRKPAGSAGGDHVQQEPQQRLAVSRLTGNPLAAIMARPWRSMTSPRVERSHSSTLRPMRRGRRVLAAVASHSALMGNIRKPAGSAGGDQVQQEPQQRLAVNPLSRDLMVAVMRASPWSNTTSLRAGRLRGLTPSVLPSGRREFPKPASQNALGVRGRMLEASVGGRQRQELPCPLLPPPLLHTPSPPRPLPVPRALLLPIPSPSPPPPPPPPPPVKLLLYR